MWDPSFYSGASLSSEVYTLGSIKSLKLIALFGILQNKITARSAAAASRLVCFA